MESSKVSPRRPRVYRRIPKSLFALSAVCTPGREMLDFPPETQEKVREAKKEINAEFRRLVRRYFPVYNVEVSQFFDNLFYLNYPDDVEIFIPGLHRCLVFGKGLFYFYRNWSGDAGVLRLQVTFGTASGKTKVVFLVLKEGNLSYLPYEIPLRKEHVDLVYSGERWVVIDAETEEVRCGDEMEKGKVNVDLKKDLW